MRGDTTPSEAARVDPEYVASDKTPRASVRGGRSSAESNRKQAATVLISRATGCPDVHSGTRTQTVRSPASESYLMAKERPSRVFRLVQRSLVKSSSNFPRQRKWSSGGFVSCAYLERDES